MKKIRSVASGIGLASAWCLSVTSFANDVYAQDATATDGKAEAKVDAKADGKADAKADAKLDAKADGKADAKADGKTDGKANAKGTDDNGTDDGRSYEGWLMTGVFAVGTGLQGGDPGTGSVAWTRARTRLIAGVDLRSDEARSNGIGFYGFAEIERRASFGAEVRYQRWWTTTIGFHASILGTLVPESMVGAGVGARFGFPIANKLTLFLEPGFAVLPFGSDLPSNSIILWGTLIGGVGVAL